MHKFIPMICQVKNILFWEATPPFQQQKHISGSLMTCHPPGPESLATRTEGDGAEDVGCPGIRPWDTEPQGAVTATQPVKGLRLLGKTNYIFLQFPQIFSIFQYQG